MLSHKRFSNFQSCIHGRIILACLLLLTFSAKAVHAAVIINEFMAINNSTLADEDGDFSDWLELINNSATPVDLNGWYLTDDPANLDKWRIPAVTLQPGTFLVVFASDKDRNNPASQLHTNFRLSGSGGYLALVQPDATTIASEFSPAYPPQQPDVSYGTGLDTLTPLFPENHPAKAFIPADNSLGLTWTGAAANEPFNDASWIQGPLGVGFDEGIPRPGARISPPAASASKPDPLPKSAYLDVAPSGQPYTSIEAAMAAATGSGDEIIRLHTGTYTHAPGSFAWSKDVDIVEAPGAVAVFSIPIGDDWGFVINKAGGGMNVTWDGIDIVLQGSMDLGLFLIGGHDPVATTTFNLKNTSITDAKGTESAESLLPFGICIAYLNTVSNLDNVDILLDNTKLGLGGFFGTPTDSGTSKPEFNLNNCTISTFSEMYTCMFGGQSTPANYTLTDCSLTMPSLLPGGANKMGQFFAPGVGSVTRLTGCNVVATENCYGLGVDLQDFAADRCVFTFNKGLAINAPRIAGWQHTYTNCAWKIGGSSYTSQCILLEPGDGAGGTLVMRHCTVVATVPSSNVCIFQNFKNSPFQVTLQNNIIKLLGSSVGIISNPVNAPITVTSGINLRFYSNPDGVLADLLTGTVIDDNPMLEADNIHINPSSPAIEAGDPAFAVGSDIDGQPRLWPVGTNPDLGCDEAIASYHGLISTDIGLPMNGVNPSAYLRVPFTINSLAEINTLYLWMKYDDGYVAYLNGTEVVRRNAPASVTWNSTALADRAKADALAVEQIDLTNHVGLLKTGTNILAIHGLNDSVNSSDFVIHPELVAAASITTNRFLNSPTPGLPNTSGVIDIVAAPVFSVTRGFFTAPFNVAITCATPDTQIYYTTDGSVPSAANPAASLYGAPVTISSITNLRAAAFRADWSPSSVTTHSYFFVAHVRNQNATPPGLPQTWSDNWPSDYGVDPDVFNSTLPGYSIEESLLAIPTLCLSMPSADFWSNDSGIYYHTEFKDIWTRPGSIELIYPDGRPGFQVDAGIKIHGGTSHYHGYCGKHSFTLQFKSEYGPSKLNFKLFPDYPVDEFDKLIVRGSQTDSWDYPEVGAWWRTKATYIRDQWMRDTQRAMGTPSSNGIYVHLYLNGLYWGQYNMAERQDNSFNASFFGGDKDEYDAVHDGREVQSGSIQIWDEMMALAAAGLSTDEAYQKIQGNNPDGTRNPDYPIYLHVENLIDYMILHLFSGAGDWPHHNWWAARRRGPLSEGFRFLVWDQEIANDVLPARNVAGVDNPTDSPAFLYGKLRANPAFRRAFGDRIYKHMFNGGALTVAANDARWLARQVQIDKSIVAESARWGDAQEHERHFAGNWGSRTAPYKREVDWLPEMNWMHNTYWPQNHDAAIQRFRGVGLYPQTNPPNFAVDGVPQHGGPVDLNAQLSMSATTGQIYYTLDGSDPRSTAVSSTITNLIAENAPKTAFVPTADIGADWRNNYAFNDATWQHGLHGVGYEAGAGYESYIGIDVGPSMLSKNGTCYIRIPFNVAVNPADYDLLTLRVRYDDGFVAWLNGNRVAAALDPTPLAWNSSSTGFRTDAESLTFADFDLTPYLPQLLQGNNLLALHGLNQAAGSSDFLISVELIASTNPSTPGGAQIYQGPISLNTGMVVKAATLAGSEWSALNSAIYTVAAAADQLRVSEMMYAPLPPPSGSSYATSDFEYIEFTNTGTTTLGLAGLAITNGVTFDFNAASITSIAPGGHVLVVNNINAFRSRYGNSLPIAGEYSGNLNNAGEKIEISQAGQVLIGFDYDNARGWPLPPDGFGHSLVPLASAVADQPEGSLDYGANWRSSTYRNGSPGVADPAMPPGLLINELTAHTDLNDPQYPAYNSNDWIELFNPTNASQSLGSGWYLSDDGDDLKKWAIPGSVVAAGDRISYDEITGFHNPITSGFGLSKDGEQIFLSYLPGNAQDRIVDWVRFKGQENDVSLSRYPDGSPWWHTTRPTRETVNSAPLPRLVISELMYHPDPTATHPENNIADEYIEIYNPTSQSIPLWNDTGTWRLDGGVNFSFPAGVIIPPGGRILLVTFNPQDAGALASFRQTYGNIGEDAGFFGPYTVSLANSGHRVALERPQAPDAVGDPISWVIEDEMIYFDQSPWTPAADGTGQSLNRVSNEAAANDPANWFAAAANPQATAPIPAITGISRAGYAMDILRAGKLLYSDRAFEFTLPISPALNEMPYIRTLNDDKNQSGNNFLSFTLMQPATVWVAFDTRIAPPPSWLSGWTSRPEQLFTTDNQSSDGRRRLFAKDFAAGVVTLGGNRDAGGASGPSMYSVIISPPVKAGVVPAEWVIYE